ncbi:MAG: FAD-dependent oxidoreductase [Actinomycetota bacterium]|nr:FAD-dependent oxidoreductase [Actinomycetota bacterium]
MRALIMGGGLAGLSAAVHIIDNGFDVTLLESEEELGGRAMSWVDEDGDTIDNALHVFFPHYANILEFFEKVGAKDVIHWTDTLTYFKEDGDAADFRPFDLPAPLHGLSLVNFHHISYLDLLRFGPAAVRAFSMREAAVDEYDRMTVEDFLHRYGVSQGLIDNMLRAMVDGLTFLEPYEVSAKTMAYWIRKLTTTSEAVRVGFARGGLGEIYVDKAVDYIGSKGGKILNGVGVKSIKLKGDSILNVTPTKGRNMRADVFVSALPVQALRRVLPEEVYDYRYFRNLWRFEDASSLSAMVWFDRKVLELSNIAVGIGTVFNWFADLTQVVPEAFSREGSVLELVITPCGHLLPLSDERIMDMVVSDIKKLLPAARKAEVVKWRLVRGRQGMFAQKPHMDRYRPTQRTPIPNLYLCGDFTRAGHSAGMEGAVVSGRLATSRILEDKLGVYEDFVVEPRFGHGLIPFLKYGQPALLALLALWYMRRRASSR